MKKFIMQITAAIMVALGPITLIAIAAFFSGTLLFFLWPSAVEMFPRLINDSTFSYHPSWWTCVSFTWVLGIIAGYFKPTIKKED